MLYHFADQDLLLIDNSKPPQPLNHAQAKTVTDIFDKSIKNEW